jgi:Transposase DDE domain
MDLLEPSVDPSTFSKNRERLLKHQVRQRVEEVFRWMKTIGGFRRTRYPELDRTELAGYLVASAYNLVRPSRLTTTAAVRAFARLGVRPARG